MVHVFGHHDSTQNYHFRFGRNRSMSLKSMASDHAVTGVKKTDLFRIDPQLVEEDDGFNLRDYNDPEVIAHIEAFAEAYAKGQYVPPWLVRTDGDRIKVIEGHCRRRGALLAISRGHNIPFVSANEFKGSDAERVSVMLRSGDGLALKVLDQAHGYLRLIRMGYTNSQVAAEVGRTPARVEQLLLLATANMDVQNLVKSGQVKADTAIEAVRKHRDGAGEYLNGLLEQAKKEGKTKVTKSSMRPKALPPKVVTKVVNSVETLIAGFDTSTRRQLAEFEKLDPAQLEGRKVEVDAAALLALLQAGHDVADVQKKRADDEAAAAATKAQPDLISRDQ
jgi:ParB family transcriptional regulator, chromosome partitioning protein